MCRLRIEEMVPLEDEQKAPLNSVQSREVERDLEQKKETWTNDHMKDIKVLGQFEKMERKELW